MICYLSSLAQLLNLRPSGVYASAICPAPHKLSHCVRSAAGGGERRSEGRRGGKIDTDGETAKCKDGKCTLGCFELNVRKTFCETANMRQCGALRSGSSSAKKPPPLPSANPFSPSPSLLLALSHYPLLGPLLPSCASARTSFCRPLAPRPPLGYQSCGNSADCIATVLFKYIEQHTYPCAAHPRPTLIFFSFLRKAL